MRSAYRPDLPFRSTKCRDIFGGSDTASIPASSPGLGTPRGSRPSSTLPPVSGLSGGKGPAAAAAGTWDIAELDRMIAEERGDLEAEAEAAALVGGSGFFRRMPAAGSTGPVDAQASSVSTARSLPHRPVAEDPRSDQRRGSYTLRLRSMWAQGIGTRRTDLPT